MEETQFHIFPFYKKMSDDDKAFLKSAVITKELEKGQILMGDNTRCDGIPMVASGEMRLFRISDKGREMSLYRVGAGELCVLAAVCAMGDIEYNFLTEAEKKSLLFTIPADVFKDLLIRSDVFRSYVFNTLAEKLIYSIDTIEMLLFVSIEERILAYLKQHAGRTGVVKTTHEKMAIDLGSSREVITRQLKKMAEKDILTLGRGKVYNKINFVFVTLSLIHK